jgi:hypothetical protein
MTHRSSPLHATTACERGEMCIEDRPGHAVTMMRLRLAHLDPDGWTDAVVMAADSDGTVDLRSWGGGEPLRVWHHVHRSDILTPGSPVSVHQRYGLLAVGGDRLNVAPR